MKKHHQHVRTFAEALLKPETWRVDLATLEVLWFERLAEDRGRNDVSAGLTVAANICLRAYRISVSLYDVRNNLGPKDEGPAMLRRMGGEVGFAKTNIRDLSPAFQKLRYRGPTHVSLPEFLKIWREEESFP